MTLGHQSPLADKGNYLLKTLRHPHPGRFLLTGSIKKKHRIHMHVLGQG